MRKHWVNFLPEVGQPMVDRGAALQEKRARLHKLLDEIGQEERELYHEARKLWSYEEVQEAFKREHLERTAVATWRREGKLA